MVCAELLVKGSVSEHLIDCGKDGCGGGTDDLLGSTAMTQALELGLQVAGFFEAGICETGAGSRVR
jgi:hypothetical protein